MGDQQISPGFSAIALRVVCCIGAPLNRGLFFCKNDRVIHLVGGLWFEHVNGLICFCSKIRLILKMFRAVSIEKLELAFGGFEPLYGLPFENYGKLSFRLRVEFLNRV